MKHLSEEALVLHYYGEMSAADERSTTTHLSDCVECRREFTRLQRVLGVIDESVLAPALPEHFERTVWARLEPNLGRPPLRRWFERWSASPERQASARRDARQRRGWFSGGMLSPAPLMAAAVLVLAAGAFFAGRLSSPARIAPPVASSAAEQVRERILLVDLGEHLDRSQMVLIELVSADTHGSLDLTGERGQAEQLLADNRLYRQTAAATGDAAVGDLLDELERVLVELAAGPEYLTSQELESVRQQIEAKGLLFRVRVVSSEVRERQKEALQKRTGQRL